MCMRLRRICALYESAETKGGIGLELLQNQHLPLLYHVTHLLLLYEVSYDTRCWNLWMCRAWLIISELPGPDSERSASILCQLHNLDNPHRPSNRWVLTCYSTWIGNAIKITNTDSDLLFSLCFQKIDWGIGIELLHKHICLSSTHPCHHLAGMNPPCWNLWIRAWHIISELPGPDFNR